MPLKDRSTSLVAELVVFSKIASRKQPVLFNYYDDGGSNVPPAEHFTVFQNYRN